jgi:hypothetical protein
VARHPVETLADMRGISTGLLNPCSGEAVRLALLGGMPERYSVFLQMQRVDDVGLVWEIRRSGHDPGNGISCSHTLGVNACNGEVAAESVERRRMEAIVESRIRSRLDGYGEWVDRLAIQHRL